MGDPVAVSFGEVFGEGIGDVGSYTEDGATFIASRSSWIREK